MPQFDPTYFISQIFWLLLSFGGLYLGIQFIVFPLFRTIFTIRQNKMKEVLERADKLTQETQNLEEKQRSQKAFFEKKLTDRINEVYQQQIQEFQKVVTATEKRLLTSLQKKIQSVESEEKKVLAHSDNFVLKVVKGK